MGSMATNKQLVAVNCKLQGTIERHLNMDTVNQFKVSVVKDKQMGTLGGDIVASG